MGKVHGMSMESQEIPSNLQNPLAPLVIVSHGNLIATLLGSNAEKRRTGQEMCSLSNPDVLFSTLTSNRPGTFIIWSNLDANRLVGSMSRIVFHTAPLFLNPSMDKSSPVPHSFTIRTRSAEEKLPNDLDYTSGGWTWRRFDFVWKRVN